MLKIKDLIYIFLFVITFCLILKKNRKVENFSNGFQDDTLLNEDIQRQVKEVFDNLKLTEKVNNKLSNLDKDIKKKLDSLNVKVVNNLSSLNTKVANKFDNLNTKVANNLDVQVSKNNDKINGVIKKIPKTVDERIRIIYKTDIEAIKNLSTVATKLQEGKLTIPGNLKITGNLDVAGQLDVNKKVTLKNELQINNPKTDANPTGWYTHFNYLNRGENYIRGNLMTKDKVTVENELQGNGYIKAQNFKAYGNVYADHWIQGKHLKSLRESWVDGKLTTGNLKVDHHTSTKELDIVNPKDSNGGTHFNYLNTGVNYLRGKQSYFDAHNWMRTGLPDNKTYYSHEAATYMKNNGGDSDYYLGFMRGRHGSRFQNGFVTKGWHGRNEAYFRGGWDQKNQDW